MKRTTQVQARGSVVGQVCGEEIREGQGQFPGAHPHANVDLTT